jgi:hypothetical protein
MRDLVGFESWLERDQVMMLDFSPEVVAFSSQPFWLTWPEGGKVRRQRPGLLRQARGLHRAGDRCPGR